MTITKTWGSEIEWGDIPRYLDIPKHLGSWEYSEVDVVNIREPYKYVAADPLGLVPPFGGEINTVPDRTYEEQLTRIMELKKFFQVAGYPPTPSMTSHFHVHVHVPGLREDISLLKKLTRYILDNQDLLAKRVGQFQKYDSMKGLKNSTSYFKYDGGRQMPEWMGRNILDLANNFDDFIRIQCCGKDGVSRGRPFRYAVNTYCLKHTQTIEFRLFRNTVERKEMESCFRLVDRFIEHALTDHKPLYDILEEEEFSFPPFVWDPEVYKGFLATKYDKSRGKKERKFVELL